MTADVRRRGVLSGLGLGLVLGATGLPVLALSACDTADDDSIAAQDQVALDQVLAGELALEAAAKAVQGRVAREAARAHRAHAEALVAAGASAPTTSPTASASPAPPTGARALALAQVQQAGTASRVALAATPRIARLLASIAASNASFAALQVGRS